MYFAQIGHQVGIGLANIEKFIKGLVSALPVYNKINSHYSVGCITLFTLTVDWTTLTTMAPIR